MNKKIGIFIFSFLALLPALRAQETLFFPDPEATISMDFQDASLKDILKIFSIQSGLNFISSETVQDRKITLYLDKVPLKEAMDKLFKANNLSYEIEPSSNLFIVRDWGRPELETVTKVFYLKYATVASSLLKSEITNNMASSATGTSGSGASSGSAATTTASSEDSGITSAIKKLLSSYGSIIEDQRTNSLVVTDIPSRIGVIEKTIGFLDVPVPQVMLEVEMLDVSKNTVDQMGFEFGASPFTLILPGSRVPALGNHFFIGPASRRGAEGAATFGRTYAQTLEFLRTRTDTKFLARPKLLTLNNQTAEIKIATQESVGVTTTTEATSGTTSASPERAETGVSLRVTPQINTDTGEITMFIYPQVGEAVQGNSFTSSGQTFQFRDPEVRNTKSVVRVKDNETVVIGGLIRNEMTQTVIKIPILGDIPILGLLFRHKDKTKDKERELLVFITPHIIQETRAEFAKAKKARLPEREQSPSAAYDRQAIIASSLNNYEKVK